ncbi:MAG: hypothetical protein VX405_12810, partial [Myxococcota bacterium]|nr:hypothetical protein [Myxococcota bacterium]
MTSFCALCGETITRGQSRCTACSSLLVWQVTCLGCGVTQPPAPRCVACGEPLQDAIRAVTAQAEDAFVTIPIQSASRPATPDVEPVVTALPHSVRPSVSSPPVVAPLLSARPVTSESNAEPDTIDEMVSLS